MKAKPLKLIDGSYRQCAPEEATHVRLEMPGPLPFRLLPVMIHGQRAGTPNWTWNGDTERPTLRPSILTTCHTARCHTWVNDGAAQFLGDCSHELAGQTVPLLDIPEDALTP